MIVWMELVVWMASSYGTADGNMVSSCTQCLNNWDTTCTSSLISCWFLMFLLPQKCIEAICLINYAKVSLAGAFYQFQVIAFMLTCYKSIIAICSHLQYNVTPDVIMWWYKVAELLNLQSNILLSHVENL